MASLSVKYDCVRYFFCVSVSTPECALPLGEDLLEEIITLSSAYIRQFIKDDFLILHLGNSFL